MRWFPSIALIIMLGQLSCSPLYVSKSWDDSQHYAIYVNGDKIGHALYGRKIEGDIVSTAMAMTISFDRRGHAMKTRIVKIEKETLAGEPVSFYHKKSEGENSPFLQYRGSIRGRHLEVEIKTSASTQKRKIPWPKGMIFGSGPAFEKKIKSKGIEKGNQYTITAFMPNKLAQATFDIAIEGMESVDILGQTKELTKITSVIHFPKGQPMNTIDFRDDALKVHKAVFSTGPFNFVLVACSREKALKENFVRGFSIDFKIKSPVDLSEFIRHRAVKYHMALKNPDKMLTIPAIAGQTVTPDHGKGWYVTVRRQGIPSGMPGCKNEMNPDIQQALKATPYLQKDDPNIERLTRKALNGQKDPGVAAKLIEAFVHLHIRIKDYAIGYATAAEVAKSGRGDCSEHALLTAAMCRNAGIPAKVVFGLVYPAGKGNPGRLFTYHAWNEVYIGGNWYGLDATNINGGYGPSHIGLISGDGDSDSSRNIIGLLNNLEIKDVRVVK